MLGGSLRQPGDLVSGVLYDSQRQRLVPIDAGVRSRFQSQHALMKEALADRVDAARDGDEHAERGTLLRLTAAAAGLSEEFQAAYGVSPLALRQTHSQEEIVELVGFLLDTHSSSASQR